MDMSVYKYASMHRYGADVYTCEVVYKLRIPNELHYNPDG